MGTRADFYVGRGVEAEWIGSITWDGYPDGIDEAVFNAHREADYRTAVTAFFAARNDVTFPDEPWPWPWNDSATTDYAYAFDGNRVYASSFGHSWWAVDPVAEDHDQLAATLKDVVFPDMSGRKGSLDHILGRSGMIVFNTASGPAAPNTFGLSDPAQVEAAGDGD